MTNGIIPHRYVNISDAPGQYAAEQTGRQAVTAKFLMEHPDMSGYIYYADQEGIGEPWVLIDGIDALCDGSQIILEFGRTGERHVNPDEPVFVSQKALIAAGYEVPESGDARRRRQWDGMVERAKTGGLVFVSMPYTTRDPGVVHERMAIYARKMAEFAMQGEIVVGTLFFHYTLPHAPGLAADWQTWKSYTEALIRRCAKVRVLKVHGWDDSTGVRDETAFAKKLGIPVEYVEA